MTDWKPGDRVRICLPDKSRTAGRHGPQWASFSGTVRQIDEPGLPRGVRVDLDYPVNGAKDCYASHAELTPEEAS